MEWDGKNRRKDHWHLDKRFTIGNILTVASAFFTLIYFGYKLDARIEITNSRMALLEQAQEFQSEMIIRNEERKERQFSELKIMLKEISDKLDRKADK